MASRREEVRFTITYDGPRVAGRMDAQALGSAMLSMAQLLETSAAVTSGATAKLEVDVVADFARGSFSFSIITSAEIGEHVRALLNTLDVRDLLSILGIGSAGGLIGLIKWLRNRKIAAATPTPTNQIEVTTTDGDSTVIQAQTMMLFNNSKVRMHLGGVVAPLKQEGIREFRAGRGEVAETVIQASEVEYFEPPPPQGENLLDRIAPEIVEVVAITFVPGQKWKFRLPDGKTFQSVIDDDFTSRVAEHAVVFGAGDVLEVDLHTTVVRDSAGVLDATHEVVRVRKHIPARSPQLDLLESDDAG